MSTTRLILSEGVSPIDDFSVGSKPYLFWDTCALLNFMSINVRCQFNEFDFYSKIFNLIKSHQIESVTSSIVYREFNDHIEDLYNEEIRREDSVRYCFIAYADTLPEPDKSNLKSSLLSSKFSDMRLNILKEI